MGHSTQTAVSEYSSDGSRPEGGVSRRNTYATSRRGSNSLKAVLRAFESRTARQSELEGASGR